MPPEVPVYCPILALIFRSQPLGSPVDQKNDQETKRMDFHGKKLIVVLIFILTSISILRLLRIAVITSPLSAFSSLPPSTNDSSPSSPDSGKSSSNSWGTSKAPPTKATALTKKEFKLLSDLIQRKRPCNLLVFGIAPQYLKLSRLNEGGFNVFLEDDTSKISKIQDKTNKSQIYKIEYNVPAKEAYELLKHARGNPDCAPRSSLLRESSCKLTMTNLPEAVYNLKWDVVVVDGPSGDSLEAPGRMGTIYTASMIARAGNMTTHVAVHDVHRTIEKWFSWEFLCEQNLVSAKGELWNFRITGQSDSTSFCPY